MRDRKTRAAEREVARCEKILASKRGKHSKVEDEVRRLREVRKRAVVLAEGKLSDAKTRLSAAKGAHKGVGV